MTDCIDCIAPLEDKHQFSEEYMTHILAYCPKCHNWFTIVYCTICEHEEIEKIEDEELIKEFSEQYLEAEI